jgi:RNA polymerase sigma factor (sigma-70 family)
MTAFQPAPDTTLLVQRAQAGDRDAIEHLFARFGDFLRPAIAQRLKPFLRRREEIDDIAMSCLGEALQSFPAYRKIEGKSIFGWLLTILIRKLLEKEQYYRAQKRDAEREVSVGPDSQDDKFGPANIPTPSETVAQREAIGRLWRMIEGLDDELRTIVSCVFMRVGYRELGRVLGCSPDAARMRARRVLSEIESRYAVGGA